MRALIPFFSPDRPKIAGGARRHGGRPSPKRSQLVAYGVMVAVALGAGAGAWLLRGSGMIERTHEIAVGEITNWTNRQFVAAGLTAQHVFVTGRGETSKAQVLATIGLESGQSILEFDPRSARQRLQDLSWVKTAQVERRLPDTIIVRLKERKALALWQHNGRHALIDMSGKIITRRNLDGFAHLPIVVGRGAPGTVAQLIEMLSRKPALFAQVQAVVLVGGRRWDIRLKNGIKVYLPEVETFAAWVRLAQLEAENRIFDRDVAAIDLRFPDRLVVRLTPAAAAKKNRKGKET